MQVFAGHSSTSLSSAGEAAEGLSSDLLRWYNIILRRAFCLQDYFGKTYKKVIFGLPPLRFQAPGCHA